VRLTGRTAVITGAGSGIGRATAELFASEGAHVIAVDRDGESAQATANKVAGQAFPEILAFEGDLAEEADIMSVALACRERFANIDILVNNAAIRAYELVTEASPEDWDAVYAVNLRGAALMAKHFIPLMLRRGGKIVNVSSVHAWAGRPGMPLYDSMKAGMLGMTRALACEHGADGIRVNAVLPGPTWTEFHMERKGEPDVPMTEPHSNGPGILKRQARPEEVAYANLFLASDESSFVTGAAIAVDGGVSALTQQL
jgi:NAD(P)-dependent dehydrogenase (short-subunit alcohol dehydrogenase family)